MEREVINFKNIVSEMESKKLKLCFVRNNMLVQDMEDNLYMIGSYRHSSYLDNLIKNGITVSFNLLDKSISQNIKDYEKEIWSVSKVKEFIERQQQYWN